MPRNVYIYDFFFLSNEESGNLDTHQIVLFYLLWKDRICHGFNCFQLRSGTPLSIHQTPEHDLSLNKQIFSPIQPLLCHPNSKGGTIHLRGAQAQSLSDKLPWRQPHGCSSQHIPAPSPPQQVCLEGLPQAVPTIVADTTICGGHHGQQCWRTTNHITGLLQDQFNEHLLARRS